MEKFQNMHYLLENILERPVTIIVIIICSVIWFVINEYLIKVENIAFNFKRIINQREYWRIITAVLSHKNFLHLVFNMVSLYSYGYMENKVVVTPFWENYHYTNTSIAYKLFSNHNLNEFIQNTSSIAQGKIEYIKISLIICLFSNFFQLLFSKLISKYITRNDNILNINAIGYSGIVFGLMSLSSLSNPLGTFSFFGISIPTFIVPYFSLIVTQFIVPQASFIGHLSGIISSYPIFFGVFFWYDNVLFFISLFWLGLLFLYSLKKTTNLRILRFIEFKDNNQDNSERVVIENNNITRTIPILAYIKSLEIDFNNCT